VLAVVCVLLVASGCARLGLGPPRPVVNIYVVHHVEHSFKPLVAGFEKQCACKVHAKYACRRVLFELLKESPNGDLLVTTSPENIAQARQAGMTSGDPVEVARMLPVIEVAKGNPKKIQSLKDLTRPGTRVALGAKMACMGRVTAKILQKAKLDKAIEPNVAAYVRGEQNIAMAVAKGQADATVVWKSTICECCADKVDVVPIPDDVNVCEGVEAVVLNTGKNPDAARQLIEHLTAAECRKALQASGLTVH
jgi:molybdate transport system substrate-binding protein